MPHVQIKNYYILEIGIGLIWRQLAIWSAVALSSSSCINISLI